MPMNCWADPQDADPTAPAALCLLPYEHGGPHEWTPEDQIIMRFPVPDEEGDPMDWGEGA